MQVLEETFRRGGKTSDRQGNTHKVMSIQEINLQVGNPLDFVSKINQRSSDYGPGTSNIHPRCNLLPNSDRAAFYLLISPTGCLYLQWKQKKQKAEIMASQGLKGLLAAKGIWLDPGLTEKEDALGTNLGNYSCPAASSHHPYPTLVIPLFLTCRQLSSPPIRRVGRG